MSLPWHQVRFRRYSVVHSRNSLKFILHKKIWILEIYNCFINDLCIYNE